MYGFIVSPYSHSAWFAECLILINKMVLSSAVVFLNPGTSTQHVVALFWIILFTLLSAALPMYFLVSDQVVFLITQFALVTIVLQALVGAIVESPNHDNVTSAAGGQHHGQDRVGHAGRVDGVLHYCAGFETSGVFEAEKNSTACARSISASVALGESR